jgi:hypothetical protein
MTLSDINDMILALNDSRRHSKGPHWLSIVTVAT